MTMDEDGPTSGVLPLVFGCFIGVVGAVFHALNDEDQLPGWIIPAAFGLSGILVSVGVIALGVTMGMQRHEWLRENRPR